MTKLYVSVCASRRTKPDLIKLDTVSSRKLVRQSQILESVI